MFDPNFVPAGPANKINPYERKINNVRLRKNQVSKREYQGAITVVEPPHPNVNGPYSVPSGHPVDEYWLAGQPGTLLWWIGYDVLPNGLPETWAALTAAYYADMPAAFRTRVKHQVQQLGGLVP